MQIPVELFVWLGGGVLAMLTVCAHLLISIKSDVTSIVHEQGLQAAEMRFLKQLYTNHVESEK